MQAFSLFAPTEYSWIAPNGTRYKAMKIGEQWLCFIHALDAQKSEMSGYMDSVFEAAEWCTAHYAAALSDDTQEVTRVSP